MKSLLIKFTMSVLASFSVKNISLADDGGRDGGGGSTVECDSIENSSYFKKSGTYFFDYAIGYKYNQNWYVSEENPSKHLEVVIDKLNKEVPFYFSNKVTFENFRKTVVQGWKKKLSSDDKLMNTDPPSSESIKSLPKNCKPDTINQIVVYRFGKYFYDQDLFNKLKDTGVAQISAMYIHELFRQVRGYGSGKTSEIEKWNLILHDKLKMDQIDFQFRTELKSAGLLLDPNFLTNEIINKNREGDQGIIPNGVDEIKNLFWDLLYSRTNEVKDVYELSQVIEGSRCEKMQKALSVAQSALKSVNETQNTLEVVKWMTITTNYFGLRNIFKIPCIQLISNLSDLLSFSKGCSVENEMIDIYRNVKSQCETSIAYPPIR